MTEAWIEQARILPACLVLLFAANAHAGPPMQTEDTGFLDPGGWEYIVAVTGESRGSDDFLEVPGAEVTYGLSADAQATLALSRVELRAEGEARRSDLGYLLLGYKQRLWSNERVDFVVSPEYSFPVTSSGHDRGLYDDVRTLVLPLVASYGTGPWVLTGQLSYEMTSTGPNAWSYGAMIEFEVNDRAVLLAEGWGANTISESGSETNWNVGIDYGLSDRVALLASFGSSLRSSLPAAEELDSAFYLGLRYDIPGGS